MPRIPLTWLAEHATLPRGADAESVAGDLLSVGLEEEALFGAQVTGPLVVGRVLDVTAEPQTHGKTINWGRVDVGSEHNEDADGPAHRRPRPARPRRGVVCAAHTLTAG